MDQHPQVLKLQHGPLDQVFSFWIDRTYFYHLNTSWLDQLRQVIPEHFIRMRVDITEECYDMILRYHGVEERKIKSIPRRELDTPGIAIFPSVPEVGAPGFMHVDGNHRFCKRFRLGMKFMDFDVAVPEIWRQCLLEVGKDLPLEIHLAAMKEIPRPTGPEGATAFRVVLDDEQLKRYKINPPSN